MVWVLLRVNIISQNRNSLKAVVIAYDITERKRAEEQLIEKNEDLELLKSINEKMNQGDSLQSIIKYIQEQTKILFSSYAAQIYFYEKDKNRLVLRYLNLPKKIKDKIEKLIGFYIGEVIIPLEKDSLYSKALFSKKTQIINEPDKIQRLMAEFIPGTSGTDSKQYRLIEKALPVILKITAIKSVVNIPLAANGYIYGLMDISSKSIFTPRDVKRIEMIAKGVTAVIKKKIDEEALQESEKRNNALLSAIPDLIFIYMNDQLKFYDQEQKCCHHLDINMVYQAINTSHSIGILNSRLFFKPTK